MKARQFFDLVSEVRDAQKSYFKTRSKEDLQRSFTLEKQLDAEIERVKNILRKQNKV